MPSWLPEGDTPLQGDTAQRSLWKWNSILYDSLGDMGPSFFPEGSKPLPSDDEKRSLAKINALYV